MARKTRKRQSVPVARRKKAGPRAYLPALMVGAALFTSIFLLSYVNRAHGAQHPDPRPGITARGVMPASRYEGYGRVAETYREAALVPAVLDGVYCYCNCEKHSGHHSLLDCFKSDHAAGCDVCLTEGALAYRLSHEGKSLQQIRAAVDGLYAL